MRVLFKAVSIAGVAASLLYGGGAKAGFLTGSFTFTAYEGQTYGSGFNAVSQNPFASYPNGTAATASFTYTGAINFSTLTSPDTNSAFGYTTANVSNYHGSGTVSYGGSTVADFSTLQTFLNSSGSSGGFTYGTWYSIDLGVLAAGTVLTLTHDDGLSLYQNGLRIGNTTAGPTAAVTESVVLGSTADTMLYYSRQNGAPSILQVNVPEPSSLATLLAGLCGLLFLRRHTSRRSL